MKKSEILGQQWLKTEAITVCGKPVEIRELPASAKQEVFAEIRRLREAFTDEAAVNDYFVSEMVFRSVIDEDGAVVFETKEDRATALDKKTGLPGKFFSEVFDAVNKLNELVVNTADEDGKVTGSAKKKSKSNTEASIVSSGSEDLPGSLDSPA